jgi:hypothetical protein
MENIVSLKQNNHRKVYAAAFNFNQKIDILKHKL